MAQPANTFDSYDSVNSIREDIMDDVVNITPEDTPAYSSMKKVSASNTNVEFMTDTLRSSGANAHIEGDATAGSARVASVRLSNQTQIFKDSVVVPDTDIGLDRVGKRKQLALQTLKIAAEQKLDIELAIFANNAKVVGNASTAREMAGIPAWLKTNVNFQSGNSGANPTGDGTDARTDDGTPTAFSQAKFDAVMQSMWEEGGKPNTCYLSAFQMNKALSFTGNNNQRANVTGADERVINSLAIYLTPWGQVKFQPSRENRSRDVFIMQDDMWSVGVLRPTKSTALAKTGDNTQRQVVTELTLICKNEKASGAIYDNTTS
tara:strand:+ start:896 stop:1855 length:960 start_codon:yes stop_codon:yes gene_type:complete